MGKLLMFTLPAWALRLLPYGIAALALGFAVWYLDHQGYQRAKRDAQLNALVTAQIVAKNLRASESNLAAKIGTIDTNVHGQIDGIRATHTETQRIIEREIASDPRLSNPDLGLTERMFAAINTTRAALACAAQPDGGIVCTLPAAAARFDPNPLMLCLQINFYGYACAV